MFNERQNYREFPYPRNENLIIYRRITSRNGEIQPPEYGDPHPDTKRFPKHKLTKVETIGSKSAQGSNDQRTEYLYWYAADVENQDVDNWQHTVADIGGTRFSAVRRLYVTSKEDYDPLVPAMGAVMPDIPKGKFTETFVLAQRRQVEHPDKTISSLYVLEEWVYVKKVTISETSYDRVFGVPILSTTTLYYRGEEYSGGVAIEDATSPANVPTYFGKIGGNIVTFKQLSENWWAVTSTDGRDAAILAYSLEYPSYLSLSVPDVLQSITIAWEKAEANGEFDSDWDGFASSDDGVPISLSGGENANAKASCWAKASPILDIQRGFSGQVPVTVYVFYCPEEDVAARIAALGSPWPKFLPVTHTITIKGGSASVSVNASASATSKIKNDSSDGDDGYAAYDRNQGSGFSKDVRGTITTLTIPPTIHPEITIGESGTLNKSATCEATCDVGWTSGINFPSAVANATESVSVEGSFSPATLAATSPPSIPTSGTYVIKANVSPFEAGYVQVAAFVFDASYLA